MRRLAWGLFGASAVCALTLGGVWVFGHRSLPQMSGTVVVSGPQAPVEIRRDQYGIPTIVAANEHDAYFALGYVHAQDRLFQMELTRRIAQGRLAEIFGPKAVASDRFMRTLGLSELAKDSFNALDNKSRAALTAYANGVNAQRNAGTALPPEFTLLGMDMPEWQPYYGLLWARLMALRLSGNLWEEVLRQDLAQRLPEPALRDLWPQDVSNAYTTIPSLTTGSSSQSTSSGSPQGLASAMDLLKIWPEEITPQVASNAWAVGGDQTASGKPLLASDPHLGLRLPSTWYLAEIRLPERIISGATAPGAPFHLIGYNDKIAWGFTTTHSDSMDLFAEHIAPDGTYETAEGPKPLQVRTETIAIRGEPSETLEVRSTKHGPVISDLLPVKPDSLPLSLAATALQPDDTTAQAFYHLNHADSAADALANLPAYGAPQQNLVIADDHGALAFAVVGRTPVRASGDGMGPFPGWTGSHDWQGWLPFAALPQWQATASEVIVSANNRPTAAPQASQLATHWPPPYRAERIAALLKGRSGLTQQDMEAVQQDVVSPLAKPLIDHLQRAAASRPSDHPLSKVQAEAMMLLSQWDGTMAVDRPEPLLFTAWLATLQQDIFGTALGSAYSQWKGLHPQAILAVLSRTEAEQDRYAWCGPTDLACQEKMLESLGSAITSLKDDFGGNPKEWRWGDAHRVRFAHPLFDQIPLLGLLADRDFPMAGGAETINRASMALGSSRQSWSERLEDIHGPGMRMTIDLADHHKARVVIAGGQSGHLMSEHYDDLLTLWKRGEMVTIGGNGTENTLFLEPQKP